MQPGGEGLPTGFAHAQPGPDLAIHPGRPEQDDAPGRSHLCVEADRRGGYRRVIRAILPVLLLLLGGCASQPDAGFGAGDPEAPTPEDPTPEPATPTPPDADGDGWRAHLDCDDADPLVWPGAPELCDGVDNDCDEAVDEDVVDINWYRDDDGDGFGRDDDFVSSCERLDGRSAVPGDCDDEAVNVHPGALIDGIDSDCDGRIEWEVVITLTVDDAYELCVDDEENIVGDDRDWEDAETYEVWLDSGTHVVGVYGYDYDEWVTGLLAHVEISNGDFWLTNSQWRHDPDPTQDLKTRAGWCSPAFDDSEWQPAWTYGTWGTPPWEGLPPELEFSPANWIWDERTIDNETQYFRRVIELP